MEVPFAKCICYVYSPVAYSALGSLTGWDETIWSVREVHDVYIAIAFA